MQAHPYIGGSANDSPRSKELRPQRVDASEYRCRDHPELGWWYDYDWYEHVHAHGRAVTVTAEWRRINGRYIEGRAIA